jgi:hypothetical protein
MMLFGLQEANARGFKFCCPMHLFVLVCASSPMRFCCQLMRDFPLLSVFLLLVKKGTTVAFLLQTTFIYSSEGGEENRGIFGGRCVVL